MIESPESFTKDGNMYITGRSMYGMSTFLYDKQADKVVPILNYFALGEYGNIGYPGIIVHNQKVYVVYYAESYDRSRTHAFMKRLSITSNYWFMIIKENNKLLLNKSLLKGTLFSLFSFINKGLVFLLLLILANFIAPAEYGYLGLFFNSLRWWLATLLLCLQRVTFLLHSSEMEKEGLTKSSTAIFWLSIVFCSVVALILIVFGKESSLLLNLPLNMLWLLLPIAFFTLYTNLNLDLFRLQEKGKKCMVSLVVVMQYLIFVLSIILVKYCLLGWEGRIYAQVICFFIVRFYRIIVFKKVN